MSFLSDFFEGNWGNLGTDISHAPSSFAAHPEEWGEVGAGLLALTGVGLGLSGALEGGALAGGELAGGELGAAELGGGTLATDLGIEDIGLGLGADAGLTGDLGLVDAGTLAGGELAAGGDLPALAFADPGSTLFDFGAGEALPDTSSLATLGGDTSGFDIPGATAGDTAVPSVDPLSDALWQRVDPLSDTAFTPAPGGAGVAPTGTGATTTPAGFAATDAELTGGVTGAATPAASPNLISTLGGYLNSPWTRVGLGLAPLALTLGMGQPALPAAAQQLQGQATALSAQGQADLAAARAGQLNPGQTATIAAMQQDLTNQWRQTLYNQGVKDISKDSRWPQIQAQIDQKVTEATTTMIQQNINTALAETGQAASALTAIANMQFQSDQAFTNNLINATKALGLIAGGTRTTTTTVTA